MPSGVEFDEDKIGMGYANRANPGGMPKSAEPKMVQWLMRKGWAKSAKSANMILLGVVVVDVIVAYLVIHFFL